MDQFSELPLTPPILKSLERMKYEKPTDVQARAIPLVLEGRDVLVTAQTGTGKTAAFAVPILQSMIAALDAGEPVPRALVLAPTRELAEQIGTVMRELTFFFRRLRYAVVIGGAPYGKQFRELGQDPAFIIGTPGRLIDHIETGTLKLDDFSYLVLDESDRMLDMGFAPQIEMIVKRFPEPRQTMMFSATLPQEVRGMVARYLKNPARVAIGEENRPVSRIQQDVIEVREGDKESTLIREIDKVAGTMIVFTKTRLKADLIAHLLSEAGHEAAALHGDLTQGMRRKVTAKFRDGGIRILVATDIAARGLDIDHVRHVFNYDLPMVPEDYVHRIGRTGRNGAEGHSVAFITPNERQRWNTILRLMGQAAPGRADGRRGYKNASAHGAFSSGGMNEGGSKRNAPFTQPYLGPSEKDAASFAKKKGAGDQPRIREFKATTGRPLYGPNARGKKFGGHQGRDAARSETPRSSDRPRKERPIEGARSNGTRKPAGERETGFHSAEAQAIREQFQARVEKAEQQRAGKLGRNPRFTGESNVRAGAARPTYAGSGGGKLAAGTKPHKGAPDTRKRKFSARKSLTASAVAGRGDRPSSERPSGGGPAAGGKNVKGAFGRPKSASSKSGNSQPRRSR